MTSVDIVRAGLEDLSSLRAIAAQTFQETFGQDNSEDDMLQYMDGRLSECTFAQS